MPKQSGKVKEENLTGVPEGTKYEITVEVDDKGTKKSLYLRELKRNTLSVVLSIAMPSGNKSPDYIRAGEIILNNCIIENEAWESISSDRQSKYFVSACFGAYELVDIKTAEVKKH